MLKVDPDFLKSMQMSDGFNASACVNCGTCTALCPMGIDILPRHLFRYVLLGAREKVMKNIPAIYSCLLCKMCEDNCPGGVRIAENVRSIRGYINRDVYRISRS